MEKIRKTNTKEIKEFKKWLIAENGYRFIDIFNYENDRIFLKNLLKEIKHIAFIKEIIKFLAVNKDEDVPGIIFQFSRKKFTLGYRSSLLVLLEKYNCEDYFFDLLKLFLKDSYNTTWFAFDILVKYIKKINDFDLQSTSVVLKQHIKIEKDMDKKEYHELFLKKIENEIKRRLNTKL
jgi:hypothetical protein